MRIAPPAGTYCAHIPLVLRPLRKGMDFAPRRCAGASGPVALQALKRLARQAEAWLADNAGGFTGWTPYHLLRP